MHIVKPAPTQQQSAVPPDSLLLDCKVDQPPELTGFPQLDEVILVKAWISQTLNLGICNVDKKGSREWKQKVQKIESGGN